MYSEVYDDRREHIQVINSLKWTPVVWKRTRRIRRGSLAGMVGSGKD